MPKSQKLVDGGDFLIQQFYGLHTAVKNPKELALGEPQDSLNFITGYNTKTKSGDNIQLRLGSALLYKTRQGAGKLNALAVGIDTNGIEWVFFAIAGKAYYYNTATGDLAPVSNGTYPAIEDMTMEYYQDLFGPYIYSGSPNTGLYAISIANKQMVNIGSGSITGYLTIRQNFGWVWNYLNTITKISYPNNLNQSNPDQVAVTGTGISNPQGSTGVSGNGILTTFSGTIFDASQLMFSIQIGAPINSLSVTSISIPANNPFSSIFDMSIVYTGGFQFNEGDYVVIQGSNYDPELNDCICTVQTVNGTSSIAVNFINKPSGLINTSGGVTGATIASGGIGSPPTYQVGDVLVIAGGNGCQIQVTSVSGGAVNSIAIVSGGNSYTVSSNNATTGGSGTGCTINITAVTSSVFPINTTLSKLELFEDGGNGILKSTFGSSGTINYVSGAFTINTQAPIPNTLNIDSICFLGIPGVVTFAPGFWAQFGGPIKAVKFFSNALYQFHTINTWLINLGFASATSTTGTNGQEQYRQNLGTSFFRAAYEKGEGILFLDDTEQNNPHFRILQFTNTTAIEPEDLSEDMDFSGYDPSTCAISSIGNYDFISLQSIVNGASKGHNDTTFLRNNISGFYDKTDFRISVMDTYNGAVIAGDTISQNVFQLFTGQDDDGAPINANWDSGKMNLGFMGLKQFGLFHIEGFIGPSQVLNIYAQWDSGKYVLIGSVYGNGKYVNMNNSIVIGQGIGGNNTIGGTGNGQLTGYYFTQDIPVWTPLFQYVSIRFVPGTDLSAKPVKPTFGALQINAGWGFRDCRIKSVKSPANTIGNN